jgi:hypothetical protein
LYTERSCEDGRRGSVDRRNQVLVLILDVELIVPKLP